MASIASLIVRIGAQDQEIQKALASVGEKARSVDADLKKLGGTAVGDKAQKSLDTLRSTMDQITKAQQAVADRATLAAAGIEAMGGAGRLTESQLKQMNRVLQDGISSFSALGKEAPEDLQKVADAVKGKLDQPLGWLQTKMVAIGSAIGNIFADAAGQAARALIQAGKAAFEYGDKLENLEASTRVSVEGLQRLEAIGVTADVTLDDLANSVGQLQKHLDDAAAKDALRKMGLDYQFIRSLKPEDQFLQIAQAVAAIEDPVARANAGAALFGKTWTTIAPAIEQNIQEIIKQTNVLSKEQVHALSEAQNAWERWKFNVGKNIDEVLGNIVLAGSRMAEVDRKRDQLFKDLNDPDQTLPTVPGAPRLFNRSPLSILAAPDDLRSVQIFGKTLDEQSEAFAKARAEAERFKTVQDQLFGQATIDHVNEVVRALGGTDNITKLTADTTKKLHDEVGQALDVYRALGRDVPKLLQDIYAKTSALQLITKSNGLATTPGLTPTLFGSFGLDDLLKQSALSRRQAIPDIGAAAAANIAALKGTAVPATKGFASDLLASVPSAIQAAIQGGGSKLQAAGSAIGSEIFGKDSGLTKTITGGITKLFGADGVLSKTLSSTIPVIGSLIGPAIAGIQKLFGKSEESAKVSPLRDEFFKAAGGLDVLNPKVLALTGNLKAVEDVFKAKTVDDYNAAIQRLNTVLATEDQAFDELDAAVKKYGVSIEELGPKYAQHQLNASQGDVLKDWQLLNAAVTDQDALLKRMNASFQDVVTSALKSGATISTELQAPIQRLADMGLLVDENGDKLTDLSRLKFGTLDSEFQTLTKAINNLTRALGGAVDEVNNLAQDRDFDITGHVNIENQDLPQDFNYRQEYSDEALPSFRRGSQGVKDFGSGTLAVLHGREAVVPEEELRAMNRTAQAYTSSTSAAAASAQVPPVVIQITGPVLAATEYVEQHLVKPLLDGIARYHRAQFNRLVAATP